MTRSLAILGAGGHGRVVADCAERLGFERVVFFDDHATQGHNGPWSIGGNGHDLEAQLQQFDAFVVGIGNNQARLSKHKKLLALGGRPATLIHPDASVSTHASIGPGSVVLAGAVVNIGTRVGAACIINTSASVDHDCILADGAHVSPGAHLAGGISVGETSWVGIGAAIREGVTIGHQVCIGAGAVVVKSVPDGLTVVGNPARPMK